MKTSLVKAAPQGDFTEVSVLMNGWRSRFETLVSQKRPIKCDIYPLPEVPNEIWHALDQEGYVDMILVSDQWQHFLVPGSNSGVLNQPAVRA
jgi:hypothetical protein